MSVYLSPSFRLSLSLLSLSLSLSFSFSFSLSFSLSLSRRSRSFSLSSDRLERDEGDLCQCEEHSLTPSPLSSFHSSSLLLLLLLLLHYLSSSSPSLFPSPDLSSSLFVSLSTLILTLMTGDGPDGPLAFPGLPIYGNNINEYIYIYFII